MTSFDIVIVGAGPAGMSAAIAARTSGASVAVIDDNPTPGGQIWRGSNASAHLFQAFAQSGARHIWQPRVISGSSSDQTLTLDTSGQLSRLRYSKLILATGARELFLPFPGWTLPGVFGVGGLQAFAKCGLPVQGKRIVVAGTGPLLLAVAAFLTKCGARVPLIAEQATFSRLAGFARSLLSHPAKIREALTLKSQMPGTRYLLNSWVTSAQGMSQVDTVSLLHNGEHFQERCDYLAVAYGFVPNTELAQHLGCRLDGRFVSVDHRLQSSVNNIYCAGEPTGLGGVEKSLLEGSAAGLAATGNATFSNGRRIAHFSAALNRAFELRPELRRLPQLDTIVCRCEDVSFGNLRQARNWSEAKLHFRCGMGACQGRICGPAAEFLLGLTPDSVRPPIFPVPIQTLIKETIHP